MLDAVVVEFGVESRGFTLVRDIFVVRFDCFDLFFLALFEL